MDNGRMVSQEDDGDHEVALTGGRMTSGIVRRGDELRRPTGSWTATVHELLLHLEAVGFTGAPRVLGVDGQQEVLTYIVGDVPVDPEWQPGRGHRLPAYARTDHALAGVARLIRRLHDATRNFTPANADFRFHPYAPLPGQVVSHGDLGPWNTVYRDGTPVAFIDWDAAQPMDPVVDLAGAAWAFVPLEPRDRLVEAGFDSLLRLEDRLRLFLDAYGLEDRPSIVPALQQNKLAEIERIKYWPIDAIAAANVLEFQAQRLRWLANVADDLAKAL